MRIQFGATICAAIVLAALSGPSFAQQKTVRVCQEEWRANKVANQAAGITEKTYVEKCRGGNASAQPAPAAAPATVPAKSATPRSRPPQKTVRACQEEWRADKVANQAAGITEKAFVERCRSVAATAQPAPAAPATPAPAPTASPAPAPGRPATTATAASPPARAATTGVPAGVGQFASEAQAKSRCPTDTVVWVNLTSKIYHFSGHKAYGTTKKGAYMCEGETAAAAFRPAKNEKHP